MNSIVQAISFAFPEDHGVIVDVNRCYGGYHLMSAYSLEALLAKEMFLRAGCRKRVSMGYHMGWRCDLISF